MRPVWCRIARAGSGIKKFKLLKLAGDGPRWELDRPLLDRDGQTLEHLLLGTAAELHALEVTPQIRHVTVTPRLLQRFKNGVAHASTVNQRRHVRRLTPHHVNRLHPRALEPAQPADRAMLIEADAHRPVHTLG